MKLTKFVVLLSTIFLLTGCGENVETQQDEVLVVDEYKKVSVTIDVDVRPNPAISTDIQTCSGSGVFMFDFWFAVGGGDPMRQEASWQLTGYDCYSTGQAVSCTGTPLDDAWALREIEVMGKLKSSLVEGFDELVFHVSELPLEESIMVSYLCEGGLPGTRPDSAVLTQIVLPLYQEVWHLETKEDTTRTVTSRDIDLSGMSLADVVVTTTVKRVASIDE